MHVVGIDVGGTKIAAALVAPDGSVGQRMTTPTPGQEGPKAMLDAMALVLHQVVEHEGITPRDLAGVGVGTSGVVNSQTGKILQATSVLKDWLGTEVALGLQERIDGDAIAVVQNDVDAHAMGEAWIGAAQGYESVLMVAPGTGVGGAFLIDGQPVRGAHHVGGEIAHMPIRGADDMPCTCGKFGHLESLGAGPALYRWYLGHGGDQSLKDTREVVAAAEQGDTIAQRAIHVSAASVGQATAGIVTMMDPSVVVISGGMANAGQRWWQAMEDAFRAELIGPLVDIDLVKGILGDNAPIIGAARMAFNRLNA